MNESWPIPGMWVGPWLILAFIIFWKILKVVIVVILTLPFPPSSYTIWRGVFGTAGIHSHSWLEECTMSKHHHYPDSEAEGPEDATMWCSCLRKPQPKLDTWRVWEDVLFVMFSSSSGSLHEIILRFREEKKIVNFCFQERAITMPSQVVPVV